MNHYIKHFSTLYYSGARKGELLALTWADINFEESTIDINKTEYNRQVTKPKLNLPIELSCYLHIPSIY